MQITVATTAPGCEQWLLELEVDDGCTVAQLKEKLAGEPYSLAVNRQTKVLGRLDGVLTTLFDQETVHKHVTLLKVNSDKRLTFPEGFVWGSATAAYQIEGAVAEGGRSPSIWDKFSATPGKVKGGDTGAEACDHYHRYSEDIQLMKSLGLQAYRFSISWSRLLPAGRGPVNPEAVRFYGSLLAELRASGVEPLVTLYHWDLPQCLEDEYGGWLSTRIIDDFQLYAEACFAEFGSQVKRWITFNEPWCFAVLGYATGEHAPGRKNEVHEPYLVAHHCLLAHARAYRCYKSKFYAEQQGQVGISLNMDWKEPLSDSEADAGAQQRALDWQFGWFAKPICHGAYPETMVRRCGDRLPSFTPGEVQELRGSADFWGLNHYSSDYVEAKKESAEPQIGYFQDQETNNVPDPTWSKTDSGWDIVPWGLGRLLVWIQKEYPLEGGITITENGCAVKEDDANQALKDTARVEYLQSYLSQAHKAIKDGADLRGYFVWSFLDNFEWQEGYSKRFGIVRVDYKTQARLPKESARLMARLAESNALIVPERILESSEHALFGKRFLRKPDGPGSLPKKPNRPTLALQDAKSMLYELCHRYELESFQAEMMAAYRQHLMDNDDVLLAKARRQICMPIQAAVLPNYGFEPTQRGVALASTVVASPEMMKDNEMAMLNSRVVYLTRDLPKETALAGVAS